MVRKIVVGFVLFCLVLNGGCAVRRPDNEDIIEAVIPVAAGIFAAIGALIGFGYGIKGEGKNDLRFAIGERSEKPA